MTLLSFFVVSDDKSYFEHKVFSKYEILLKKAKEGNSEDKFILFEYVDNNEPLLDEFITNSFKILVNAATSGHIPSQLKIGGMYMSGYRVPQNLPVALTWFIGAANEGNVEAELLCGINYALQYMDENKIENQNPLYKESDYWLTRAMTKGNITAKVFKFHLALIHYEQPPFPALEMLSEVAEEGNEKAMFFLGEWHKRLWVLNKNKYDYEQAVIWLEKAESLGDKDAGDELDELKSQR